MLLKKYFANRPGHSAVPTARLICLAVIFLLPVILSGCSYTSGTDIHSVAQLEVPGRVIAVSDGTPEEALVRKDFPDAQIQPFTDIVAAYTAVAEGKADALIHSRRECTMAIENGLKGVHLLEDDYCENTVAAGISKKTKIPHLREKINAFLEDMRTDGTLDEMYDRWVVRVDETMPDIPAAEDPKMTVRVGTTGTVMPYSYYKGDKLSGFDIELAERFAAWLDAGLVFSVATFPGILAAAQTGDVDCVMSNLYYTEEHDEAIDFSDPVFKEIVAVMVKGEESEAGAGKSFWDSVRESFAKTFLRESRWKLLLKGVGTTILITVLSVLLGTLLGFAVYMACRGGNPAANSITRFCVWLVQGMPVVVFLMILYYIVFNDLNLSNTAVSVIGFTLIFAAAVFSILKTGLGTVDGGQAEAALALGFSDRETFFRIMLPQALPHMVQPFTAQITALIKATSVVGYIAVQDLTKMSDIIRSRTYEAFFPLITVAVLYFVIAALLTWLARRISARFDSRQRRHKPLLKGVKVHD